MTLNLRMAIRRLTRTPLYSLSVCAVLGLTGAALTAAGVTAYAVLVDPLPYAQPEELVLLQRQSLRSGGLGPFSPADYLDVRSRSMTFEALAAAESWSPVHSGDGTAERLTGLRVSGDLFTVLGVGAARGRVFEPLDDRAEAERTAVISHRLWQRLFGGELSAVGDQLRLDGEMFTVLGVMPAGFEFPTFWVTGVDVWTPLRWSALDSARRNSSSLRVFGRLATGVTASMAEAEVRTISESLRAAFPESHADRGARVLGLQDATVREVRPVLLALAAGSAMLWLIALANLTVLALVRATGRISEEVIRRAMGESTASAIGRDALEGAALALVGSGLGAILGFWAIELLATSAPGHTGFILSRWEAAPLNGLGLVAVTAPAFTATMALALAQRSTYSSGWLVESLRARDQAGASKRSTAVRSWLTGGEIALAVVLVAGAGLLDRSLMKLLDVDPGFHPERVTTAVVPVTGSRFADPARKSGFYRTLLDRLNDTPGIETAAAVNHVPLVGDRWGVNFLVEGQPIPQAGSEPGAAYRVSTPGYFRTIGARLVSGRDFATADHGDAPAVAVVNQTFADRHLAEQRDPVGARIRLGGVGSDRPWRTVVGIVADIRQQDWTDIGAEVFLPFEQDESFRDSPRPPFSMTLVVRSAAGSGPAAPLMRRILGELDSQIPVDKVVTLERAVSDALWQPRMTATLLSGFSFIALVLAAVGVYGTAAQVAAKRRSEFGIRMALGASKQDVLTLALSRNVRLITAGVAAGTALAWTLSGLMGDLLYEASAQDGIVFVGSCGALALTGLAASYLPARSAASIDPATALRQN